MCSVWIILVDQVYITVKTSNQLVNNNSNNSLKCCKLQTQLETLKLIIFIVSTMSQVTTNQPNFYNFYCFS
jgi:hypothetical protein